MPRKIKPKDCACGCGMKTRGGRFKPGHDAKVTAAMVNAVGGVEKLLVIVESSLGRKVRVEVNIEPI